MSQPPPHPGWQQPGVPQPEQPEKQAVPSSRGSVAMKVIVAVALTVSVAALGVIVWALVLRGGNDQVEVA